MNNTPCRRFPKVPTKLRNLQRTRTATDLPVVCFGCGYAVTGFRCREAGLYVIKHAFPLSSSSDAQQKVLRLASQLIQGTCPCPKASQLTLPNLPASQHTEIPNLLISTLCLCFLHNSAETNLKKEGQLERGLCRWRKVFATRAN